MFLPRFAVSVCVAASLAGCATLESFLQQAPKPSATPKGARLESLDLQGAKLVFDVEVQNPYAVPLPVSALNYSLASGGQAFLSGEKTSGELIPAHGKATIPVPADLVFAELLRSVDGVKPGGVVPYTASLNLKADAPGVGPVELPVSTQGNVPVPAPPEVKLAGVQWTKLGLDESRGVARVEVKNTNSFPVELESLRYSLALAEKSVAEGTVEEKVRFEPGAAQTLELPLTVSAARLGLGMLSLLRGAGADYRLDGGIQFATEYGPLGTTFDRQGKASFSRAK